MNYPITEPIRGLPEQLPGISGLVLTSAKENELVEIPIISPLPAGQINPVLAHWSYGLGRSVAFTSDAGRRWAKTWPDWQNYAAFWSQVVRWSMRPADRGNLTLNVRREQGRIKVVIDALDNERSSSSTFLRIQGKVVDPDLKASSIELKQTAPGRYEATIDKAEASGNYFVNLGYRGPDDVQGIISTGVSVPYSDEYRELRSNPTTLETLADLTDGQFANWKFLPDGRVDLPHTLAGVDHFRRGPGLVNPRSFAPQWAALLWLAACVFLVDVAVRRIALDVDRIREVAINEWRKLFGQETAAASDYMDKLKSRKAEVDEQLDRSRAEAADRPEGPSPLLFPTTPATGPIGEPLLEGSTPREPGGPAERKAPGMADAPKEPAKESYTNRLLKAKQRVWEERDKEKPT